MSAEAHPDCPACQAEADEVNRRCPGCRKGWDGWRCNPCGVWPCVCEPTPGVSSGPPASTETNETRRHDPRESQTVWEKPREDTA